MGMVVQKDVPIRQRIQQLTGELHAVVRLTREQIAQNKREADRLLAEIYNLHCEIEKAKK